MRRELIEAINIQAKRDGIYLPIIKAVVFEELSKKYKSIPLKKLLNDSHGGSWGEDYLKNGLEALSLRSPDMRHGFIDFENARKRFYDHEKFVKFQLRDGDIIVIKSNGSIDLVGKSQVFISNENYPNVTASNFLMILKPNMKVVSPLYLDTFLKSPQSLIWRVKRQRTTTGLRNLDSKGYLSINVPLPENIEDQSEIVQIIEKLAIHEFPETDILDISKIELASKISERFNELLFELDNHKQLITQLKQSILQEAIQGKLTAEWRSDRKNQKPPLENASELLKRIKAEKEQLIKDKKIKKEKALPPIKEEEIPFDLPEGWVWCRLGEILLYSDSGKSPQCEKIPAKSNEWGVLTTTAIQKGCFIEKENKVLPKTFNVNQNHQVEKDDILITRAGPLNRTGVSCKVESISSNLILSDKTIRLKHAAGFTKPDYIVNVINSDAIRNLLIPKMTGMAVSQVNISQSNIKSTPIPFAPLSEQQEIVKKVEALMVHCEQLELEIKKSEANAQMLMQAVLKEAFGGGTKKEVV